MDTKAASKAYHRAEEALNDVLSEAMCELYKDMTGKPATDRLRDALYDAVRFNN